jgi:hypothetical protein
MKYLQKDLTSFCIRTSILILEIYCKQNSFDIILLEVGEQAQKMYGLQAQKCTQDFLLKGITIANDCD